MNEVNSVTPVCEVCGRQLRSINRIGICTVNLECLRERDKRAHEGKRVRPTGRQKCKHTRALRCEPCSECPICLVCRNVVDDLQCCLPQAA